MPTYEYECTICGKVLEEFQSMSAKPKRFLATDCKECDNRAPVRRMLGTGAGVIFKGSGFYQTDYRSDNYKKGEKAETEAATPKDAKSDAAPKTKSDKKTETKKPKEGE
jgi:putative FmdB family regulatory protein